MVFIHCLLRANYEDTVWRGTLIKRGDFITSVDTLSKEVGISTKMVRTALGNLKRSEDISVKGQTVYSVITVVNYDKWQEEDKPTGNKKDKQPVGETATDKKIRSKEVKNIFPFRKYVIELGVEEKIVDSWLAVRKTKRATNTETAFDEVKHQIELSGATAQDCIRMAASKSWSGFKAQWYKNELNNGGSTLFGEQPATEYNPKGKHTR